MSRLAILLEQYMEDSNTAQRITVSEAIARGGIPLSREVTTDVDPTDRYAFLGALMLEAEKIYSELFMNHRIIAFTGYTVKECPDPLNKRFRVSTIAVQASEKEWFGK